MCTVDNAIKHLEHRIQALSLWTIGRPNDVLAKLSSGWRISSSILWALDRYSIFRRLMAMALDFIFKL